MATWEDVARIALDLPETSEGLSRGTRHWRVKDKGFVWERPLRKADLEALGADAPDGDILGARVADEGVKFALIADDPAVYFTTPPLRRLSGGARAACGDRRRRAHRAGHRGVAGPGAEDVGQDVFVELNCPTRRRRII